MTDAEIIKALECCTNEEYTCGDCAFEQEKHIDFKTETFEKMPNGLEYCDYSCDYWLLKSALDLIKRQQAEIEILEQSCQEMSKDVKRLWKDCDFFEDKATNTAKVFAEKLKESLTGWDTDPTDEEIEYVIDKLLKEMVGANNDR